MKATLYLILSSLLIFASCADEDTPISTELVGTWQLTEVLADPGDGSGEFQPFVSDKVIRFFEDGRITSNSALCVMDSNGGSQEFTGSYDSIQETISPDDCNPDFTFQIKYEKSGKELILYYTCIEPCAQKYIKSNS